MLVLGRWFLLGVQVSSLDGAFDLKLGFTLVGRRGFASGHVVWSRTQGYDARVPTRVRGDQKKIRLQRERNKKYNGRIGIKGAEIH